MKEITTTQQIPETWEEFKNYIYNNHRGSFRIIHIFDDKGESKNQYGLEINYVTYFEDGRVMASAHCYHNRTIAQIWAIMQALEE